MTSYKVPRPKVEKDNKNDETSLANIKVKRPKVKQIPAIDEIEDNKPLYIPKPKTTKEVINKPPVKEVQPEVDDNEISTNIEESPKGLMLDEKGINTLINEIVNNLTERFITKDEAQKVIIGTLQNMVVKQADPKQREVIDEPQKPKEKKKNNIVSFKPIRRK